MLWGDHSMLFTKFSTSKEAQCRSGAEAPTNTTQNEEWVPGADHSQISVYRSQQPSDPEHRFQYGRHPTFQPEFFASSRSLLLQLLGATKGPISTNGYVR